ncbi:MAG: ribosome maturation factor RimM [Vicinamibacterales bacterium]|nr:ribosome maturation factor RimM [Vicinamibacterales bacterium]
MDLAGQPVDWDALTTVGRIARTHGLRGQVVVNLETDFPEARYQVGTQLWLRRGAAPEAFRIAEVRFHQGRPILRFDGIESIEAAEALGRGDLRADPATFEPLPPRMFRHSDLVGCDVTTRAGRAVGRVVRVDGQMTNSLLVVATRRGEALVPLAEAICVDIDPGARRIVIEPPEGLLEL